MPQILLFVFIFMLGSFWNMQSLKQNPNFIIIYTFGFIVLFSFISFMKHVVFELLEWNGTDKNNWFYILWWGLVLLWSVFGIQLIKNNKL